MEIRSKLVAVALLGTLSGGAIVAGSASAAAPAGAAGVGGRAILAPLPGGAAPGGQSVRGFSQIGSFNWSGFAQGASNGTYKSVVDTWTVPTVNTSLSGSQFSSDWVGIGGLNDGSLVQAGTEADNSSGTAIYRAWTEVLPAAEDPLTLVVHPGDKIKTTVKFSSTTKKWTMTVKDITTGLKGSRTATKAGAASTFASVEAIHERPCIADGCTSVNDLADLTKTNNVTFDPGKYGASSTPTTPLMNPASGATVDQIFMVNNADTATIAAPSNPDSDNDGFAVAYGSTQPAPPSS
jgi:Peptidase A4 family